MSNKVNGLWAVNSSSVFMFFDSVNSPSVWRFEMKDGVESWRMIPGVKNAQAYHADGNGHSIDYGSDIDAFDNQEYPRGVLVRRSTLIVRILFRLTVSRRRLSARCVLSPQLDRLRLRLLSLSRIRLRFLKCRRFRPMIRRR